MFTAAVTRVEEGRRRRITSAERLIIPHIGPEPAGAGLALGQHRYGGVVGMNAFGYKNMRLDRVNQRHQSGRRGANPVRQCRYVEINALAGIGRALPVERQMQAIFGEQHLCEQMRSGAAARDRVRGGRRLGDRFAGAAGELLAHVLDHFPLPRHHFQHLGHILADLAQVTTAATRAGGGRGVNDTFAWQMLGQWTARRLLASKAAHRNRLSCRRCRYLGRRLALGCRLFQIGKLKFELFKQHAPFRRWPEPLMAQLGDGELQLFDQQRQRMSLGLRCRARCALGNQ